MPSWRAEKEPMMGTKNHPGDFDCYENAEPDEPMFVLLARDRHASDVVREWVAWRAIEGRTDQAKLDEAMRCAAAMDAWRERREGTDDVEIDCPANTEGTPNTVLIHAHTCACGGSGRLRIIPGDAE